MYLNSLLKYIQMQKYILQDAKHFISKSKPSKARSSFWFSLLVFSVVALSCRITFAQTNFSANFPLSTNLTATTSGDVTANAVIPTGLFLSTTTFGASGYTGTGLIGGVATASCLPLFNGISTTITPYIEFTVKPVLGNQMTVNTISFTVSNASLASLTTFRTLAAGYSTDGGISFTGFTPTVTGTGATANQGPLGSTFNGSGTANINTFTFALPSSVNVGNGSSLKIRIVIWRNNASNSSGAQFTVGPLSVSGTTSPSSTPAQPTLGALTVPSPKVVGDAPFTLTDPISDSTNPSATFSYTSSDVNVATISGKTVTLVGPGTTTITATQAPGGLYGTGSTSTALLVYAAPEQPVAQTLPYTQDFGTAAFTALPTGLAVWQTSANLTTQALAEASVPYIKGNVSSRTTALATTLTPAGLIYAYGVPDATTLLANNALGFLLKSTNSPQLVTAINTVGLAGIKLNYDVAVEKVGDASGAVVAQYRVGNTGAWTTITGSLNTVTALGTTQLAFTLPDDCNNREYVQIRWATWYGNATSCIFTIDNIAITSTNSVISLPTASSITHNSATLGATLASNANTIAARGTVYSTSTGVAATDNTLAEGATTLGAFTHNRNGLAPQTTYFFKGYAQTGTQTFLSPEGSFRTLSAPATAATSANSATAISQSQINLAFTGATFPTTGATTKGYVVLAALFPNTPTLGNTNGAVPTAGTNTTILNANLTATATTFQATGLNAFSRYNFVIVPFTWNGTNADTYNYYTTSLPIFDGTSFAGPPSVQTVAVTAISSTSATSGGTTVNDGGGVLSGKGVVWSTNLNPTIADNKLDAGTVTSSFTSVITGLTSQTLYNLRAYATNNSGTQYGSNISFRTLSSPANAQASGFTAVSSNTSTSRVDLSWTAATFPGTGATVKGYVLLYAVAPNVPSLSSVNGQAPAAGVNTSILSANVVATATSYTDNTLPNSQTYNYLLVPYTWDGTNASTYNYLITNAPTATSFKLPLVTASGATSFCIGNQITLTSNSTTGNTWLKNGVAISGANAQQLVVNSAGSYTVSVNWGTISTVSVPVNVTIFALPVPNITSTNGTKISKGTSTQLSAGDGVTYLWSPNKYQWIDNVNIPNPTVKPDVTTTFTVTVTNANGCSKTESITIEVENDFKVTPQTMITPNGDGKNDVWIIKNIDAYPDNEVKVFDASGRQVYRKQRYNNSWDGTYNGQALPTGSYSFIIYFGSDKALVKGYLTILK
jgi:gliding motility-associated-like protein